MADFVLIRINELLGKARSSPPTPSGAELMNDFRPSQHVRNVVSDLPPTTLYALAAPSTPEPVRKAVVERLEAGERIETAAVNNMIREARSHADMAAVEARITEKVRNLPGTRRGAPPKAT
jgi:hypothetical protein